MVRGLISPQRIAGKVGRGVGGGHVGGMFRISGLLFSSKEIVSLLDRKSIIAMESVGQAIRRSAKRSLKPGKRYSEISQIPTSDPWYKQQRIRARIQESQWLRGTRSKPPVLPFKASRPGATPRVRLIDGNKSPLRNGIIAVYDPTKRSVVVGAAPIEGTLGIAPSVLEHGGTSNGFKIAARPFMSRTLKRMHKNGQLKKLFSRSMKV